MKYIDINYIMYSKYDIKDACLYNKISTSKRTETNLQKSQICHIGGRGANLPNSEIAGVKCEYTK